ncbi:hypothetical protein ACFW1A_30135 [Kitasatospora sp. NPDC058965]|uniref:hypothetical protein n=1 Tax=Kitasatospora sp. NPDC058965 TaxID=3346682 RepID=UPI00368AE19B
MERVVDLDQVAMEVDARVAAWRVGGLTVGELTWRDHAFPWAQQFLTDRARVGDPDSVGVTLARGEDQVLEVVLYRGGWADVGFLSGDDGGALPANDITSAADFGRRLDGWVSHVFSARPTG